MLAFVSFIFDAFSQMEQTLSELEEECDTLQANGKKKSKRIQELEEQHAMVEHTIRQLREESEKLCEEEVCCEIKNFWSYWHKLKAKRNAILTQQIHNLEQQKEGMERENSELQAKLQQATRDAGALVVLADKMRKKAKAARVRDAKARTQLGNLHRIVTSIVKQDLFLGSDAEDRDAEDRDAEDRDENE
jgi:chromosome segregation ATPase